MLNKSEILKKLIQEYDVKTTRDRQGSFEPRIIKNYENDIYYECYGTL